MDELEEKLKFIFGNVNDWLKFGEAKNGALLAINITSTFATIDKMPDNYWLQGFAFYFICLNLFSAFTVLISYIPHLKSPETIHKWLIMANTKNALFYGDLSQMTSQDLLNLLDIQTPVNNFNQMMADQIICNSKIATKKYEFFTLALHFTVTAYIIPIFAIILYHKKSK